MEPLDPLDVEHALLHQLLSDQAQERLQAEEAYQQLFPGHERLVAELFREVAEANQEPSAEAQLAGRFGSFEPLEVLGRGGQGVVYLARDTELPRHVALKVLTGTDSIDSARQQRFRREAEVAARLDHPGLCRVLEFGIQDDVPYLAMQYVPGTSLAKLLADEDGSGIDDLTTTIDGHRTTSRIDQVIAMVVKVARALHVAHDAGVVHRDIKPANIMITPEGEPVVLDFGLARDEEAAGHLLTISGDMMGTPAYMAPEQVSGTARLDRRTDVFALGLVLYECLTGFRPFDAPTRQQMFDRVLRGQFRPVSERTPRAARDLDLVLAVALEVDRDRRYETTGAFADDLQRVLRHEPVMARPVGWMVHLQRWIRRNRVLAGSLAAVLAISTAATLLTTSAWIQARTARGESDAINEFILKDLLAASNPRGLGREVRVVDALHRSVQQIDRRLGHRPRLAATVRLEIAKVYSALGLWEQSNALAEVALATRQQEFGSQSPQALEAELRIATTLASASRTDEARAALEALQPRLDEVFGANSTEALTCRATTGTTRPETETTAALVDSQNVLDRCIEHFGPVAEVTRLARMSRITLLRRANRIADSLDLAEEQANLLTTAFGETSFLAIESRLAFCDALLGTGQLKTALALLPDLVAQAEITLGENHPEYLVALHSLGACYSSLRKKPEAVAVLRLATDRATAALGREHPWTLRFATSLALALRRHRDLDDALTLTNDILATKERLFGPDSAEVADSLIVLASIHRGRKDPRSALAVSERALSIQESLVAKDDLTLAPYLYQVAESKKQLGDRTGAIAALRRQIDLAGVAYGPENHWRAQSQRDIAELLYGEGEFEEAERFLREALAFREQETPQRVERLHTTRALYAMTRYRLGRTEGVLAELESAFAIVDAEGEAKFRLGNTGFFTLLREIYKQRGDAAKLDELDGWLRKKER